MNIFEIDPDITRAATLASRFYTDERFFEASKERIFARSWQMVGHTGELAALTPFTVLESFLDEPVLFARAGDELRCLSNVCTHRGKILVEEPSAAVGIRCGYHGRRFALDGRFLSMPEFEGVCGFPAVSDDLTRLPFAQWRELLFVALDPRAPFEEVIAPVEARLAPIDWPRLEFSPARSRDYFVNAHWALYCENYLEGFHVPFVHQGLNAVIDYGAYTTETYRFAILQTALSEPGAVATGPTSKNETLTFDFDRRTAALYFFVFPNLMLNFYPWGLSVNVVKPLAKDLTKVTYLTFVADESKLRGGAGGDLHRVELEDQMVVESVQRGLRSRFYDRGRYSPARETGTHHFHRLIAELMR